MKVSNTHTSGKEVWVFALVGFFGRRVDWRVVVRQQGVAAVSLVVRFACRRDDGGRLVVVSKVERISNGHRRYSFFGSGYIHNLDR